MTKLLFIDFETTGLDPIHHAAIELGCIWTDEKLRTIDTYHTYIKPFRNAIISREAMEVNRINLESDAFLTHAVTELIAVCSLEDYNESVVGDEIYPYLAGWNIQFDSMFLKALYKRTKAFWKYPHRLLDVQSINSFFDNYSFKSLSKYKDVRHNSLVDISMTLERLRELTQKKSLIASSG